MIERILTGNDMIKLERIDHFVMRVADVGATCSFYEKVLGMEVITFNGKDGVVRKALRFGQHKINLHPDDTDWFRAKDPHCGGEDFCVITETPMDDVVAHLNAARTNRRSTLRAQRRARHYYCCISAIRTAILSKFPITASG